jgi:hypothetical protein
MLPDELLLDGSNGIYKFRLGCNWARHLTSMIAFARMIFGVFWHFNHQVFACDNRLA